MAKDESITKHTLNLYSGDYAKIQSMFPDVGAGPIIRRIVRQFITSTEAGVSTTETLSTPINL